MDESAEYNPWLHRYALLTAVATFLLVIAGGLVTSTGSGLAVPDWPLSYGTLFPPMIGGIFYEHGHRMIAATVGFMTVVLALWLWRAERRSWVRRLGAAALAAVVMQGALGGITVLFLLPTAVSVAHAGLAMAFFGMMSTLAMVTSRAWLRDPEPTDCAAPMSLATAATALVYVQVLLGATVRHTASGLACPDFPLCNGRLFPAIDSLGVGLHLLHRLGAVAVGCVIVLLYRRIMARHATVPALVVPSTIALMLVGVQFLLGALTVWNGLAVEPTTAHVGGGALLLITMVLLTLQTWRGRMPAGAVQPTAAAGGEALA